MKEYLKEELRRVFTSFNTKISLILCFLCLLIGGFDMLRLDPEIIDFADTFTYAQTSGTSAFISLAFPILCCLPYSHSYVTEYKTGFINYLLSKMKKNQYIKIKLIITGFMGGTVIAVPTLLFFFICLIRKGTQLTSDSGNIIIFFKSIYFSNPVLYILILILNSFLCGTIFAILGLGISTWIQNKYAAIFLPFCFYIFSGIVLGSVNRNLNAITLFCVNQYNKVNEINIFIYDLILLIIGVGLFYTGVHKDERKTKGKNKNSF